MNNPFQLFQAIRNPQQFIQNMMNNNQVMQNQIMSNAMKMYQNGDVKGLQNLVQNVANEKGMSVDDIRKNLGI